MKRILVACTLVLAAAQVSATPINCADTSNNYMSMSDTQAMSCLDAGTGNISGNPATDAFLLATSDPWVLKSKDDVDTALDPFDPFNINFSIVAGANKSSTGTWSFDSDFWNHYEDAALGFKFGTGGQPDEWFVFEIQQGVSSGDWAFHNVFGKGGGLSHINLYASKMVTNLPEPNSALLMLFGALMLAVARRKTARS
ncbi:PEP-CTERM sorting domain-containing protein [Simiduia sp. 21SJ11W-1]|uniref:PEP-CTERM sorting domain-containing protein n=1 Tax=Simiduia sp. 21SJ11W-1 TaxID=2909669 RepID=UPI0020A0B0FC|nr:PEP-CTERM sorting domain-containing protein [Simiduia sp. 21SJ11W-1]UTA48175.1 PEP-CTERM sorting domain-containing protein [Simiduia sp. 21SJ11W-1]